MTFGEKLKVLRKEHNYSQEELAQILDVSRQAVSKWESDRSIPETDKLVQISTILGATLDYLLKTDHLENNQQCNSYYVSREIIEGFLSYKQQGAKKIAIGVNLIVLSNLTNIFSQNQFTIIFYWLTLTLGIAVLVWHIFQPNRYKEIGTKPLLFDDVTIKQFRQEYNKNRKRYVFMIIIAIVILILSPQIVLIISDYSQSSISLALSWVLHAIWLSLVILAGLALNAESIIAQNAEYMQRKARKGKYTLVYIALPITALTVAIGIFTDAWNPIVPIIALFCVILATVCNLLIEERSSK
ncbi:helix-turn-helix domain-containing protein [Aminipila sp.]|uniref:helix-turn-helix domain-containing protein n=1 Tax=Aminipila sp. TaxID=2060095 RepID=UPI00289BFD95|nr:helix-turn-helix transcriptional regulator [Aminipila sp.]